MKCVAFVDYNEFSDLFFFISTIFLSTLLSFMVNEQIWIKDIIFLKLERKISVPNPIDLNLM